MDASSIKARASNRRSNVQSTSWKCNYCNKSFIQERSFMQHQCKGKQRVEVMKTPIGQSAFASYGLWMKARRYTVQNITTFMSSQFFTSFIKFAEYCDKLSIDASAFVTCMKMRHPDILKAPSLWCSSPVYSLYLAYYDDLHDPWEQVIQSQSFIERKAEVLECKPSEVLYRIGFQEVLQAFRLKKLSPWYLYTSRPSADFLRSLDNDDYELFKQVINYDAWYERFSANRDLVTEITEILNPK